jgi:2-oxoglutarate dehydrogenase E2 component (dihydrolipoamide succinyltransferase)
MDIELKIPAVGESITEVQIGEWLKAEGDNVKQDEPVAVIDSDKTTFELPAPQSGRLIKILHQAGETVPVGAIVALIQRHEQGGNPESTGTAAIVAAHDGGEEKSREGKSKSASAVKEEENKAATETKSESPPKTEPEPKGLTPKPENKTPESKPQPRKTKEPSSAGREEETVPMTMLRRTMAQHLIEARQTMAMLTTCNEADMSAVQALRHEYRETFEKHYQAKLGLMSFFIKAAVDALKQFPQLNARVNGSDIVYHNYFDIGVAVASERGLAVPVLRNAESMTFAQLEKAIGDFARRARDGSLKPDELAGGTFTITNGGVFGSLLSTPIINAPQSGILGLHSIQERPVAVHGEVVIRPMMYLALTYDHRIVDGREAVLFLSRIKQAIESPVRMLVEI